MKYLEAFERIMTRLDMEVTAHSLIDFNEDNTEILNDYATLILADHKRLQSRVSSPEVLFEIQQYKYRIRDTELAKHIVTIEKYLAGNVEFGLSYEQQLDVAAFLTITSADSDYTRIMNAPVMVEAHSLMSSTK